jgi:subtilase family serine protease
MRVSRVALGAAIAVSVGVCNLSSAWALDREIDLGASAATDAVPFTVYFNLTNTAKLDQLLHEQTDPHSQLYHHWLTPADFKAQFGPAPAAVAAVKAELAAAGMTVTAEHAQSIEFSASASAVQAKFGVHLTRLQNAATGHVRHVSLEGHPTLSASLTALGVHVMGLQSAHINNHLHSQRIAIDPARLPAARLNIGPTQAYFANDMKAAYGFPSFQTYSQGTGLSSYQQIAGLGTNIGILMSSIALNSDLGLQLNSVTTLQGGGTLTQDYSGNSNLPVPSFTIREVSGGSGAFGNSAADEASLDTQMSLGTAQGATEQLYDIPDLSDSSTLAGYTAIVEDNTVDVVSSSFGGCEFPETVPNPLNAWVGEGWVLDLEHQIYQQGNAQGITFVASSGDEGSLPCPADVSATGYYNGGTSPAAPGVEEPAADPNVTGVGGTNLATTSTAAQEDMYIEENSYGDPLVSPFDVFSLGSGGMTGGYWGSGGGISQWFAKPDYQNLVNTRNATQRTVPDIAMQMGGCPGGILTTAESNFCNTQERSFTLVAIGGQLAGLIGTSSSSPQFAGVVAHMIELAGGGIGFNPPAAGQPAAPVGRMGNINPMLYSLAATQIAAGGPQAPANLQYFNRRIQGFSGFWGNNTITAYSYVLGVGTPNVTNLLGLQGAVPAGNPGTITNP